MTLEIINISSEVLVIIMSYIGKKFYIFSLCELCDECVFAVKHKLDNETSSKLCHHLSHISKGRMELSHQRYFILIIHHKQRKIKL